MVLMSGAAGARPPAPAPTYAACDAAIEGLGRGLALEHAPVRVNVVSPSTIDGNLWAQRPARSCTGSAPRTRSPTPCCSCSPMMKARPRDVSPPRRPEGGCSAVAGPVPCLPSP
ncbi:hypothetical protein ACOKM5_38420 [Streptomyces sp. BH097]|uniref:hypothetical protein n=1 Tax=unclassified Streptomyces TaxID=2593676 RepID=UPI003BB7CD06